jgi:hypothetical protein
MKKLEYDIDEIKNYLSNWNPSCPALDEKVVRARVKSSYKQFHALLVWGLAIEADEQTNKHIDLYFTEAISDLSQAYFLNLCSLYKAARSSLRSAIENTVRVLLLHKGVDIAPLNSVYDMFARVKHEYKADTTCLLLINKLHAFYGDLCKSVHSASVEYLSLSVPFEKLSVYDAIPFFENNDRLRDVSSAMNQCAFWMWSPLLVQCGHKNVDLVLDALPRSIKRAKTNAMIDG